MASAGPSPSGSGRGKRSLEAETNLIPFIDLLSVCICFLLMTAVWTQIASLNVKQLTGTDGPSDSKEVKPLQVNLEFKSPKVLSFSVKKKGRVLMAFSAKGETDQEVIESFKSQLDQWALTLSKPTNEMVESAMISPKRGVNYGQLVSVMDVLRNKKIVNIGVIPKKD